MPGGGLAVVWKHSTYLDMMAVFKRHQQVKWDLYLHGADIKDRVSAGAVMGGGVSGTVVRVDIV